MLLEQFKLASNTLVSFQDVPFVHFILFIFGYIITFEVNIQRKNHPVYCSTNYKLATYYNNLMVYAYMVTAILDDKI